MRRIAIITGLALVSCSKTAPIHPPVGGLGNQEMVTSKNRAKSLNLMEREQIEDWISRQHKPFYTTSLNYWTDVEQLEQRERRQDGDLVSFEYEIYDFAGNKFYLKPRAYENAPLGKFEEIEAVEDALRYLRSGEQTTLLVPSLLGYGTYGDGDQISFDMPLLIKLKLN